MRRLRLLFLALLFVLSTSASAAASVRQCCPDQSCDLALCVAMGCAPALPSVAFDKPMSLTPVSSRAIYAALVGPRPADYFEKIWTPPD